MIIKDYYKILEVSPAASASEIKRSFRRLAHKYHPDKNAGNNLYELKFKEINEAYRVLSDTQRRTDYNFSRSGNQQAQTKTKTYTEPVTTTTILLQARRLKLKTAAADPNRINKEAVFQQVKQLLSRSNLDIIKKAKDAKVNAELVEYILAISKDLPHSNVQRMIKTLVQMAGTNNPLLVKIRTFERENKFNSWWNEYKVVIAVLLAVVFSILIYIIST